jgi:hypothetical protein
MFHNINANFELLVNPSSAQADEWDENSLKLRGRLKNDRTEHVSLVTECNYLP